MPPPPDIEPMLPGAGLPPTLQGWSAEPHLVGWRARVAVHGGELAVRTNAGHDLATSLPQLRRLAAPSGGVLLDGVLVAGPSLGPLPPEGEPVVPAATAALRLHAAPAGVTYVAFDLLWAGEPLIALPQRQRRARLVDLGLAEHGVSVVPSRPVQDGIALVALAERFGTTGLVLKDGGGRYQPGVRSTAWRRVTLGEWRAHLERRAAGPPA